MPILPVDPKLKDLQHYIAEMEIERGFSAQNAIDKCLLLGEEIGELFKAVRAAEGIKIEKGSYEVAGELADVLIYICAIANRYGIDLEKAFREKELINHNRSWEGR